jgi:hypothetical protein
VCTPFAHSCASPLRASLMPSRRRSPALRASPRRRAWRATCASRRCRGLDPPSRVAPAATRRDARSGLAAHALVCTPFAHSCASPLRASLMPSRRRSPALRASPRRSWVRRRGVPSIAHGVVASAMMPRGRECHGRVASTVFVAAMSRRGRLRRGLARRLAAPTAQRREALRAG